MKRGQIIKFFGKTYCTRRDVLIVMNHVDTCLACFKEGAPMFGNDLCLGSGPKKCTDCRKQFIEENSTGKDVKREEE